MGEQTRSHRAGVVRGGIGWPEVGETCPLWCNRRRRGGLQRQRRRAAMDYFAEWKRKGMGAPGAVKWFVLMRLDHTHASGRTTVTMKLSEGFTQVDGGMQGDTSSSRPNSLERRERVILERMRSSEMEKMTWF